MAKILVTMMSIKFFQLNRFLSSKKRPLPSKGAITSVLVSIFCLLGEAAKAEQFELLLKNRTNDEARQLIQQYLAQLQTVGPQVFVSSGKIVVSGSAKQFRHFNDYWRFTNNGKRYLLKLSKYKPKQLLNQKLQQAHISTRHQPRPRKSVEHVTVELGKPVYYRTGRTTDGLKLWQGKLQKLPPHTALELPLQQSSHAKSLQLLFLPQGSNKLRYRIKTQGLTPQNHQAATNQHFSDESNTAPLLPTTAQGSLEIGRWYSLSELLNQDPGGFKNKPASTRRHQILSTKSRRKTLYLRIDPIKID